MLNAIIIWSLRHRFLVIALSFALVLVGAYSLANLPIDAFPEFAPPRVEIQTNGNGARMAKGHAPTPGNARTVIQPNRSPIVEYSVYTPVVGTWAIIKRSLAVK